MENTIVFRIDVGDERSYALLAGFIYKRERHMDFLPEEMKLVRYKYYFLREPEWNLRQWACRISADGTKFESVNEPDKIKNITEKYQVIYCIRVSEDCDVAELHNLFLIKNYYAGLHILILFEEYENKNYHKVSQFLYRINIQIPEFYDSCFFVNDGKARRGQLKGIQFSRNFIPLQIVDQENLAHIFAGSKDVLSEKYLRKILNKKTIEFDEEGDIVEGGIKRLREARNKLLEIPDEQLIQIFQETDVFSFNLLCYVISVKQDEHFDVALLESYAFQMRQYSMAVRQLAENIVFHSKTGIGVIAVRLHKKNSEYVKKRYHAHHEKKRHSLLEIIVSDFCGDNQSGNIAENFIANLEDEEAREAFIGLKPSSFFEHGKHEKINSAWNCFYKKSENIGKHFGLRIFQSVVSTFDGFFSAESHSGYTNQPGDIFFVDGGEKSGECLPGTRYEIAMPFEVIQKVIKKQDLSLDSGINIGKFVNTVQNYHIEDMNIEGLFQEYLSQENKNRRIQEWSEYIYSHLKEKVCDIVYVSLGDMEDGKGEILAKALVMAFYRLERDTSIVFYQCADQLKKNIFETLKIFYQNADIEGMFFERKIQIAFYSKEFEELIIDLSSAYNTDNINAYIAHMKCITSTEWYLNQVPMNKDLNKGADGYVPYDILHEVEIDKEKRTLFEHYTAVILNHGIQTPDFGCKLEHTHMRLGSTIHIDEFYEAEILFDNKLFVSRFAMLLVKDMKEELRDVEKLTLYGYGTYSETVLVQMLDMISSLYPDAIDVDYIILEREEEKRGFLHKDRIRYNRLFQSEEERTNYFKDRKIVTIVLINSTLKTHLRLISLFKEENKKEAADENWLLANYAVLLIGNADENRYWELQDKRVRLVNGIINPIPRYFVHAHANYQEPSECEYCFPKNPIAEIPLVEVNAASTIPNQGFGIIKDVSPNALKLNYQLIQKEEVQMECLRDKFIYNHTQRNENHFLYYFKTEHIWVSEKDRIRDSLRNWKQQWSRGERLQYNIIVAPMHFSNAGFIESVNQEVFGGNAILLRIDFDKEYRSNAYTKFSYLRNYVKQLYRKDKKGILRVHFVDDVIISGRTYHRAKSLVESVLGTDQNLYKTEIRIFDKVFVMIDRNSLQSRRQYVRNCKKDFYSFIHINISSLRNYGDSCIFCNLRNEAELLYSTASTRRIAEYWEHCMQKFKLNQLEDYGNQPLKNTDRAFRRLFCTHMAQNILEEKYHGNDHGQTIYLILKLLRTDYEGRDEDRYEYFLSYLKCISRPFLVFKRAVKEAIFDILLLFIDTMVQKKTLRSVIETVVDRKPYLAERRLILLFNWLDRNILNHADLTDEYKRDLVKLLMKQLTELKSNYIIRPAKMEAIFRFMDELKTEKNEFEVYYMTLIDRLVSSSSDTNKSVWLDKKISGNGFQYAMEDYRAWVILENTKAFRDGIEKLYIMASEEFSEISIERIKDLKRRYDYHRVYTLFEDFQKKNNSELKEYREADDLERENIWEIKKRIQRFINSLPELETIDFKRSAYSLELQNGNWGEIFDFEKKMLKKDIEAEDDNEHARKEQLTRLLNKECDSYQYGNFYKILSHDGYMDGQEISTDGADMIACCMKVMKLCRDKSAEVLDKVQELAMLFKIILMADKVQFIIESKAANHLDEWKVKIEEKYNDIVKELNKEQESGSEKRLPLIHIRGKRHYTVMEQADQEDYNAELSSEVETLLTEMADRTDGPRNYIVSREHGIVIWELENSHRSIWISVENRNWRGNLAGQELKIARDMRRVMVFYQELKSNIFNPENDDFLNEISRMHKELHIFNSNKIYTHTKDYQQEMQFEQAVEYFKEGNEKEKCLENYPSYVLNLLADINVSKYYRDGLHNKISEYEKKIRRFVEWERISVLLRDKKRFVYRGTAEQKVFVELNVKGIDGGDAVLCEDSSRSVQDLTLLIYSLILNAAEQGRGRREIQDKIDEKIPNTHVQNNDKCVIVELFKENGCLVIKNMCEEPVHAEEIKRSLNRVPKSEEDGISLWGFNCYIKQCISSMILEKIKETEENISKGEVKTEKVRKLGEWINKLTGSEYEIKPDGYEDKKNGQNYFKVMIPIFMEKYQYDS